VAKGRRARYKTSTADELPPDNLFDPFEEAWASVSFDCDELGVKGTY
jgi:hypothetical protein